MMFKRDAIAMWIAGITSVGGRRGLLVEASEVGDGQVADLETALRGSSGVIVNLAPDVAASDAEQLLVQGSVVGIPTEHNSKLPTSLINGAKSNELKLTGGNIKDHLFTSIFTISSLTDIVEFDGFESGDFTALQWSIDGVDDAWVVDETKPYEGSYSSHIKTADIPNGRDFSQLDLALSLEDAGFVQFYFNAPVAMPFESFELHVDGKFLTPLMTPEGNWTRAGAIISSGEHVVSWRYSNNPGGAPDDIIRSIPQPSYRIGEAWLDNIAVLPTTKSFIEDFQDFSTNDWTLSGDADWTITNTKAQGGLNSATVTSTDINENTGLARLSIDIITEQGGKLSYWILPSVGASLDVVRVLVNDVVAFTYSNVESDWITQEVTIQPGKREVKFELQKNPDALSEEELAAVPKPEGYLGQVWLDTISFTPN